MGNKAIEAWEKGLDKAFANFGKNINNAAVEAKKSVMKTIDKEAADVANKIVLNIKNGKTGGLKKSFRKVSASKNKQYGYKLEFDGYDANGTPYQLIANTINIGFPATKKRGTINGTFFISNALKGLKGLDERIVTNMEVAINSVTKEQE